MQLALYVGFYVIPITESQETELKKIILIMKVLSMHSFLVTAVDTIQYFIFAVQDNFDTAQQASEPRLFTMFIIAVVRVSHSTFINVVRDYSQPVQYFFRAKILRERSMWVRRVPREQCVVSRLFFNKF